MESMNTMLSRLRVIATDEPTAPPPPVCPRCAGTGFLRYDVPFGDPSFGKLQPCGCKHQEWTGQRSARLREALTARCARVEGLCHLSPRAWHERL